MIDWWRWGSQYLHHLSSHHSSRPLIPLGGRPIPYPIQLLRGSPLMSKTVGMVSCINIFQQLTLPLHPPCPVFHIYFLPLPLSLPPPIPFPLSPLTDEQDSSGFRLSVSQLPGWAQKQVIARPSIAKSIGTSALERATGHSKTPTPVEGRWAQVSQVNLTCGGGDRPTCVIAFISSDFHLDCIWEGNIFHNHVLLQYLSQHTLR